MPKIPDAADIQRAIPRGQAQAFHLDTSLAGAGLRTIGEGMLDYAQRRTKLDLAEAEADFLSKKAELDGMLDEDNDYGTLQERYDAELKKAQEAATARISDPDAKNFFAEKLRPTLVESSERVRDVAFDKEKRVKISDLDDRMAKLRESAITGTPADMLRASQAQDQLIDSYVEMGYIDPSKRAELKRKGKADMAAGRIKMLAPEDRVNALAQPWAQNLPSDTRAELMREAEAEQRRGKAQVTADYLMDNNMTQTEGRDYIRKKYGNDPKMREAAESRFDYALQKRRSAELEARETAQDKWFSPVRSGAMTVQGIKDNYPDEWDALGAEGQAALYSAQRAYTTNDPVPFNLEVQETMTVLLAQRRYQDAREYFMNNMSNMSLEQQKVWSKATVEGALSKPAESALTVTQSVNAKLDAAGITAKPNRAMLLDSMNQWQMRFQEREGRAPTDRELNDAIDRQLIEADTTWAWGGSKPIYEMTDTEKLKAIQLLADDFPDEYGVVTQFVKKKYGPDKRIEPDRMIQLLKAASEDPDLVNAMRGTLESK